MSSSNSLGTISQSWNALPGDTTGRTVSRRIADGAGTTVDVIHGLMVIGGLIAAVIPGALLAVLAIFASLWAVG
jgi:hypothetical protein